MGSKRRRVMVIAAILLVILACIIYYFATNTQRKYEAEVREGISAYEEKNPGILSEADIKGLPVPVQKYLRYTRSVGKPKVWDFRAVYDGRMKSDAGKDLWMKISGEQYNFFRNPTRMFYIKGSIFGISCYGLHAYKNETGTMLVKALGLVPVVNGKGKEMNEGDCVTLFNDMCLMAPPSLIDKRITWEEVDNLTVKAAFHNGSIKVSATLYFNEKGELINFVSDDRYLSATGATYEKLRWSTPVKGYNDFEGRRLVSDTDALWTMPDGSLSKYAEFHLKSVEYNRSKLK